VRGCSRPQLGIRVPRRPVSSHCPFCCSHSLHHRSLRHSLQWTPVPYTKYLSAFSNPMLEPSLSCAVVTGGCFFLRASRPSDALPFPLDDFTCAEKERKKTNRGQRLTPEGLRPRHPRRGGRRGGNAGQHETRAATRAGSSNYARCFG
jgi:hypothetical protein